MAKVVADAELTLGDSANRTEGAPTQIGEETGAKQVGGRYVQKVGVRPQWHRGCRGEEDERATSSFRFTSGVRENSGRGPEVGV